MARPHKEGLDYFPLDVGIEGDDKLVVPMSKFGMQGLGIIIRLMSNIYKNSYFYRWDIKEQHVFASRVNVDINSVNDVVNECLEWGFFDKPLFDEYRILTSRGFQKRYIEACKRRKVITFIQEYTRVDLEEAVKNVGCAISVVDVNGIRINVYINPDKVNKGHAESTQIEIEKEKESKRTKKTLTRQRAAYAEDSQPYKMAVYLHGKIMAYAQAISKAHLVAGADMQKWADDCRKLLELDKRDPHEAKEVIDWATSDPFWQQNILSPSKLRDKYMELALKMGPRSKISTKSTQEDRNEESLKKIREAEERDRKRSEEALLHHPEHV